jgi:hypothetical protein
MSTPIGVFISHRHEDRSLAELVETHLRTLGQETVDVHVSHNMPGGTDYRHWIKRHIHKSDVFVLLFTEPDANWEWCIFEAGRFLAKSDANQSGGPPWIDNLVVLKNKNIDRVQGPLEGYQHVTGDKPGIRGFLVNLFENGTYTDGAVLVPKLSRAFPRELDEAAGQISEGVSNVITPIYYHEKLTIEFDRDAASIDTLLHGATLRAPQSLLDKLGCDADTTTWVGLVEQLQDRPSGVWIEDLRQSLYGLFREGLSCSTVLEIMAPFRDEGYTKYVPILLKLEKYGKQPKRIKVIFVQCNDYLRGSYALERERGLEQVQLLSMLRMSRRFRWEILEPFAQGLEAYQNTIGRRRCSETLKSLVDDFQTRLERMQREIGPRFSDPNHVQDLLQIRRENYIRAFYTAFFQAFEKLPAAVGQEDIAAINQIVSEMRRLNKRIMVLISHAVTDAHGRVQPRSLTAREIIADAYEEVPQPASRETSAAATATGDRSAELLHLATGKAATTPRSARVPASTENKPAEQTS